jgi:hypothetical protein
MTKEGNLETRAVINSAGSVIPGLSRVRVYLLKVQAEIILRQRHRFD